MNETRSETVSALFGGQLSLRQFSDGHRVGTDAVLLAAAADLRPGERFIDVGAGVGAVGLWLAAGRPDGRGVLLEVDAPTAGLAEGNAAANGLATQIETLSLDLFDRSASRAAGLNGSADLVVTNPPFYRPNAVRASPHAGKARAQVGMADEADPLAAWLRRCADFVRPKGRILAIHRPDALPSIWAAWRGRIGGVQILPVHAKSSQAAVRVLVGGIAGSRAPLSILPGLVLHDDDGRFTPTADAVHRGQPLPFWPIDAGRRRSRPGSD